MYMLRVLLDCDIKMITGVFNDRQLTVILQVTIWFEMLTDYICCQSQKHIRTSAAMARARLYSYNTSTHVYSNVAE